MFKTIYGVYQSYNIIQKIALFLGILMMFAMFSCAPQSAYAGPERQILEKTDEAVASVIGQMQKAAPEVLESSTYAIQYKARYTIDNMYIAFLYGIALFAIGVVLCVWGASSTYEGEFRIGTGIVCGIIGVIIGLLTLITKLDPDLHLRAENPKAAIALKILERAAK